MKQRPISLLICALGGEGGGVLTEWLVDIARHAGYAAQATSIPGVAQRTGATTYYIEVFPVPMKDLGGKRPVFSLNPVPGALDALLCSELLETARQVGNGLASPERTLVITSSSRALTTMERMQMGDGRVDSADLLKVVTVHKSKGLEYPLVFVPFAAHFRAVERRNVVLGRTAFLGLGAYTLAILSTRVDISVWVWVPLAGVVAGSKALIDPIRYQLDAVDFFPYVHLGYFTQILLSASSDIEESPARWRRLKRFAADTDGHHPGSQ